MAGSRRRPTSSEPDAPLGPDTTGSTQDGPETTDTTATTPDTTDTTQDVTVERTDETATQGRSDQPAQDEPVSQATATETGDRAQRHTSFWVAAAAAAAAFALLAGALVHGLRPAMADTDRTAAVSTARTTLENLLSYSGAAFDKHVAEVTPRLASPFKDEFTKVAGTDIKPMAVKNGATVQAKVFEAGVMDTTGDGDAGSTVRVMAFVNQATTTKTTKTPAVDQNRVIATMTKAGNGWLLSKLEAY